MQYTEQISPWKQTEANPLPLHLSLLLPNTRPPKPKHTLPLSSSIQLNPSLSPTKSKLTLFQPIIVTPQLLRSKSIKETAFQALPTFPSKRTLISLTDRSDIFKTNEFISLAKSYSKQLQPRNIKKQDPTPRQLRAKLQGILKHEGSPNRRPSLIARSSSEVRGKGEGATAKEKNIIFTYAPHSQMGKDLSSSPKKKGENHILDKLLQEWK